MLQDDKSALKCANCKKDPASCLNGESVVGFPPSNGDLKIKVKCSREITSDQGRVSSRHCVASLRTLLLWQILWPKIFEEDFIE